MDSTFGQRRLHAYAQAGLDQHWILTCTDNNYVNDDDGAGGFVTKNKMHSEEWICVNVSVNHDFV